MTKAEQTGRTTETNSRDSGDDEPTEPESRRVPFTILKPALLHQEVEALRGREGVSDAEIDKLLVLAEEVFSQAHSTLDLADQINWGKRLREDIRNPLVFAAFSEVKRFDFMWEEFAFDNHLDVPIPIPAGQTISQPSLVAMMMDELDLARGQKILEIGSGSGFVTAASAHVVGSSGLVIGVEKDPILVRFGQDNLAKYPVLTTRAEIRLATHQLGLPQAAPFDRIIGSGQIKEEWLPLLIAQLSPHGGVLVIPVASETSYGRERQMNEPIEYNQRIVKIIRNGDEITKKIVAENTAFVPIKYTPTNGQKSSLAEGVLHQMTKNDIIGTTKRLTVGG